MQGSRTESFKGDSFVGKPVSGQVHKDRLERFHVEGRQKRIEQQKLLDKF